MKVLVCHDGSAQADKALRLAATIVPASEGKIAVLAITEHPGESKPLLEALNRGKQFLDSKKIESEVINKSGEPIEEIEKWTNEVHYDLVVIGAVRKAIGGPYSMSLKAYQIIKTIKPPVLVVIGAKTDVRNILICTGGKRHIEKAVTFTGNIARCVKAKVSLLHVMPGTPAIYDEWRRDEVDPELILHSNSELGRNLRREKQLLEELGVTTEIRLRQGYVVDEIFSEIDTGNHDLIVTGSSLSTGPLQTYILGDVTREIVNRANVPVLVVRGDAPPYGIGTIFRKVFEKLTDNKIPAK